ncbi:MAG: GGDEF domain-containing protein [Deltaproteobacteria bacterium]|nr:GGDEF domain-containing protein [Deltaproteobacteria bacterium]
MASSTLISEASWLKREARYPEALEAINQAIALLKKSELKDSLAKAYRIAGQCYYATGLIDKCLENYHSALKIYEELGLEMLADETNADIIGASIFLDKSQKSIDYAYQFINDGRPKSDALLAQLYTNIALAYFIDQPAEAIKVAKKALTFADNEKSVGVKVDALSLLGHSLIALKSNNEAREYLEQAESIIKSHDLKEKKQQIYNDLARYYYEQGETQKALQYVNKALPIAKTSENFIGEFISYSILHDIYAKTGDFKKADHYSQIIIEISHDRCKDKLIKEQKAQSIKYDLQVRNKEIELLKQEKSIKELKLNRQFLITAFAASAMLLVGGLALAAFIAYRNNARALRIEARLSRQDPLTKLFNRRAIYEILDVEIARFERSRSPFSLLLTDIDYFKKFNDQYGHDCGDTVLKMLSETFKNMIRKQDKIARWGGEEFLIILPETETEGAFRLAEKLRQTIADTVFEHNGIKLNITMSFGVSQYIPSADIDTSVKAADKALFRAKKAGRNRVICA